MSTTNEATDSSPAMTGPTYADARRVAASSVLFDEPTLARTSKTAGAIADRVVCALISAGIMPSSVVKPVATQDNPLS